MSSNEKRPKLKAQRFNKFAPSASQEEESENKCSTITKHVQKNLANNRLQKLKERIKEDVKINYCEKNVTNAVLQQTQINQVPHNIEKHEIKLPPDRTRENHILSPTSSIKKNLANSRLQNIRKLIVPAENSTGTNNTAYNNNYASLDKNPESPKLITNKEKGFEDLKTVHSISESNALSTNYPVTKRPMQNVSPRVNTVPKTNGTVPVQQRLSNIKSSLLNAYVPSSGLNENNFIASHLTHNLTDVTCSDFTYSQNQENRGNTVSKPNLTCPVSQRLSMIKAGSSNAHDEAHASNSHWAKKSYGTATDTNNDLGTSDITLLKNQTSPVLEKSGFDISAKFAMTAAWVAHHHQDISANSEDSLKVNADESFCRIKDAYDETDDMEWSNAEPLEIIKKTNKDGNENEVVTEQEKSTDLCLVVDTNIFISGLSKIQDILDLKVTGPSKPVVYVPWMVWQELDDLKHSSPDANVKTKVIRSLKFLENAQQNKHPRLKGQTVDEMKTQEHIGKSPDDKILSCCLQAAKKYENVILVSNDVNLKNKAMINNFPHVLVMK
ncbi:hypothetical protein NQ317_001565 [Molorchus minor]|uniref:PIN domain-containing protein n=1 Tax=Molorchus minor TaxID=1323400 RepID=A0ABQ9J678_9CUCU|nr:hypothetical protein NQ317_001565 [Molorchus minor]